MKTLIPYSLLLAGCAFILGCNSKPSKVLIFSKTAAFRHQSIEVGVEALQAHFAANGITVDATEDAAYFTEDSLQHYAAIIFLNTTGDVLNNRQQADFERYIQAGGGFLGIHAASDTEYNWPWFNALVGAYFDNHPAMQDARLHIIQPNDPSCQHLPDVWTLHEEWYNFKSISPAIDVLIEIDETSYEGGTNGPHHPISWKQHIDGGRAFFTALGHKPEIYADADFLQHVMGGLNFVMGGQPLDYAKAKTPRLPEENRFSKRVLDFNLDEPMELDELGNRGILYAERRGAFKLYNYKTQQVEVMDSIDVNYNNEDGLLGFAVDPNYNENHWIYVFYSPAIETPIQHISRFTLDNNQLTDEKILLKIPLIRQCCHSGGSLEFGPDGLLYIGVGDNTNPFESSGFAPIDERPGRKLFDAQRSASNTNDLRGKILRIKPEMDGSYSIPDGNLFPVGTPNTRPEIYVMGCRNPFRFSIDAESIYLYWGDVGPDAGQPDSLRGPKGMGEFNQAKQAGYYGWPYSRGNNQMYFDYDFERQQSLTMFDPNHIINNSPNNTGQTELPPIQESMIWYGYDSSEEFPWLHVGGVNPMSGPIYHAAAFPDTDDAFPAYFNEKWFVYEWMRDWKFVVELDDEHQLVKADPFMPNTEFSHPMDMIFASDGKMYVLEYGQKWRTRNLDARLSVITYNPGNRPPVPQIEVSEQVGTTPFTVEVSAAKSYDYDHDRISYTWSFGGEIVETEVANTSFTFNEPGVHEIELTVTDSKGESASAVQQILAGNEAPVIQIELEDPNTIYWNNRSVNYKVVVKDAEDGNNQDASLDASKVKVTFNYIPEGEDLILASVGHQQNAMPEGLELINASGCRACHAEQEKVAGPSFVDIAIRYEDNDKQHMISRVIKGSQGVWGEQMMSAHPQLNIEEVESMVDFILSLDPAKQVSGEALPSEGKIVFDQHTQDAVTGKYVLMASYLDNGIPNVEGSSLSAVEQLVFIAPRIELENALELDQDLAVWETQGRKVVGSIKDQKFIKISPISFDDLSSITVGAAFSSNYNYEGVAEIRKGSAEGPKLGAGRIHYFHPEKEGFKGFDIPITPTTGLDTLFLVFQNPNDPDQYTMNGDWIQLNYDR